MGESQTLVFDLAISRDEYLKSYQGVASQVFAVTTEGVRVRFPASILRPYVTHRGIYGRFEISVDHESRFSGIRHIKMPADNQENDPL